MPKASFLFLILFTQQTFACLINAPRRVVVTRKTTSSHIRDLLTFSDCSEKKQSQFISLIRDYRGELTNRQIQAEKNLADASLKHSLTIEALEHFLQRKINKPKHLVIKNAELTTSRRPIVITTEFDEIHLECQDCHVMGNKTSRVTVIDQKNNSQQLWVKFQLATQIKALAAKDTIRITNRSLSKSMFTWKMITTTEPEAYFQNIDDIRFYKINHTIKRNSILRSRQLTPVNLVSFGSPVKTRLMSGHLHLTGRAIANKSGKIGDLVSLKNIRTKKIIIGKVIDKNLVEIEL